jgi:hypothetical protein
MMNERIKQLEAQCWESRSHPNAQAAMGDRFNTEKFAELIVRECAKLTRWQEYDMSVEQRIRLGIYQEIKEHFGVEQ